ncbi:hypothetical protein [Streptomyces sp. NPDC002265]|uniref:hypothetical protein n=1 Tax=Streptomyces sp. NPDC002265 TaxID=3154415 RepID=UPI003323077E
MEHCAVLIAKLPTRPITVVRSFGGVIAQKLLGQDRAAAAVAIDAAQIKSVLPLPLSALKATFPVFKNPAMRRRRSGRGGLPGPRREPSPKSRGHQFWSSDMPFQAFRLPDRAPLSSYPTVASGGDSTMRPPNQAWLWAH